MLIFAKKTPTRKYPKLETIDKMHNAYFKKNTTKLRTPKINRTSSKKSMQKSTVKSNERNVLLFSMNMLE